MKHNQEAHNPSQEAPKVKDAFIPAPLLPVDPQTKKPYIPYVPPSQTKKPLTAKGVLYSQVHARVAVKLVKLDHAKNPERYKISYVGVLAYADTIRYDKSNPYTGYFYLVSLAKALCAGMTMAQWVDWASQSDPDTLRSIHKRPFNPRGR